MPWPVQNEPCFAYIYDFLQVMHGNVSSYNTFGLRYTWPIGYMTHSLPIMLMHILCIHIFLAKDVCTKPTWSSYRHPIDFFSIQDKCTIAETCIFEAQVFWNVGYGLFTNLVIQHKDRSWRVIPGMKTFKQKFLWIGLLWIGLLCLYFVCVCVCMCVCVGVCQGGDTGQF